MFDTEFGTVFYAQFIDEVWWHHRLVLCRTALGNYIVTPEGYVHEETWTEYQAAVRCMRWEFPDRIRELGDPHNSFRSTDLVDGSAFVRRALASFPAARRLHRALGAVVGVPRVARARVVGVPAYFQRVSPGTRWFIYEESALGARGCQIEIEVDDETSGDLSWCLLRRRFVVTLLGALPPVGLHIPIAYVETSEEETDRSDRVPPVVEDHQGDAGGSAVTAGSASDDYRLVGSRPSETALVSFRSERVEVQADPPPQYSIAYGRRRRRQEREEHDAAALPYPKGKGKDNGDSAGAQQNRPPTGGQFEG